MIAMAASLFMFLALVTGSVVVFAPGRLGRKSFEDRIRSLRPDDGNQEQPLSSVPTLKRPRSSIPTLRRLLSDSAWAETVALDLQRANIQLRVGEYLLMRLLLAALFFILPLLFASNGTIGLVVAVAAGAVGYYVPALYVKTARSRRSAKIEKQLVEFLPMLAASLRAGFALQQGIETAAEQMGAPLSVELDLLINDVSLGSTMQDALQEMGRRVNSTDLDMIITAILVQRATGGNLSEILEQTAETLRERERIKGDIQTLTTQQRLTGMILSVYPIGLGLLLLAIMPGVWSTLFTEPVGQALLVTALVLQVLGFIFIRRAVQIEI